MRNVNCFNKVTLHLRFTISCLFGIALNKNHRNTIFFFLTQNLFRSKSLSVVTQLQLFAIFHVGLKLSLGPLTSSPFCSNRCEKKKIENDYISRFSNTLKATSHIDNIENLKIMVQFCSDTTLATAMNQYQHACAPHSSPYICYSTRWKNLLTHQDLLSVVIVSLFLITCVFDQ